MQQIEDAHYNEYGTKPEIIVSTPGRIHLIGEHGWYFKDKTLSMAVNLPVYVALSVRDDTSLRFHFVQTNDRKRSNLATLRFKKEDRWSNSLKAIIAGFSECGFPCKGLNVSVYSDVLPSSGFGITTAMKVGTALGIRALFHPTCSDSVLLQVIERGNKYFLNTLNNNADLFTALYSEKNSCLLTDYSKNTYTTIPLSFDEYAIILTDSGVPRVSLWNEESLRTPENFLLLAELKRQRNGFWTYEESDTEINDILSGVSEEVRRRLICIMKEHKFVLEFVNGVKSFNYIQVARAINKSHEILRDLYNISCPEIDWLAKRVYEMNDDVSLRSPYGCSRITGKGFGRCTYTVLKHEDIEKYVQKLTDYERIFGFHPTYYIVKPAAGAKIL